MTKFLRALKGKTAALAATASTALVALPAMASGGSGVDVGETVTAIQGAGDAVTDIGKAVILIFVGIAVYKWVRRAL